MQLLRNELTPEQELRASVMAAMETGNAGYARTLLTEYREIDAAAAHAFSMEVVEVYGMALL